MSIVLLFVSAGVLFDGAFPLWVSLIVRQETIGNVKYFQDLKLKKFKLIYNSFWKSKYKKVISARVNISYPLTIGLSWYGWNIIQFRTQSNISDGVLCKHSQRLSTVSYNFIVHGIQPLTNFDEISILDVRLGSEYASVLS